MERGPQRKISYTLPLPEHSSVGHRLGVSGLAYDHGRDLLYTGGRDGVIRTWQTNTDHRGNDANEDSSGSDDRTSCYAYSQVHTHWINALTLAHHNQLVVSASSDTTVKCWRPFASDSAPQPLGNHTDYVKALASPSSNATWVASGGLDHHIRLWSLENAKEQLGIRVTEPGSLKGSIYALAATESFIASGGPENIIKLWDSRSGKRISQLIGHTDNVRGILLSHGNVSDTLISCSADRTVKIWSLTAARCVYSFSMHTDSVWSLYSDHQDLDVFYSGDRAGMIVKTDSRGKHDIDEGFSIAIGQEQEGINAIAAADNNVWAATASSTVHRWRDVDKNAKFQSLDEARNQYRTHAGRHKSSISSVPPDTTVNLPETIPLNCLLRLPEVPGGLADIIRSRLRQSSISRRRASLVSIDNEVGAFTPLRSGPEESLQGSNGLVKCLVLNDKRHVLTADTAGEVIMWDILKCSPVKSFGKHSIDEVFEKANPSATVPSWFDADTNTGALICTLSEDHCFTADVYADELRDFEGMELKEDQRINLGVWVLRYLFDNFVLQELKRDELLRGQIEQMSNSTAISRNESDNTIPANLGKEQPTQDDDSDSKPHTPLAETPGLRIDLATPRPMQQPSTDNSLTGKEASSDKHSEDYFTDKQDKKPENEDKHEGLTNSKTEAPVTPTETPTTTSPTKENNKTFGQRLKGTFGPKKGKGPSTEESVAPQAEMKVSDHNVSPTDVAVPEADKTSSLADLITEVRTAYLQQKEATGMIKLTPLMTPSLPTEAPILRPPANTSILIQEHHLNSGWLIDVFSGQVGNLGAQVDQLERAAPYWLGTTLLKNTPPAQEISKISFLLQPHDQLLANVTADNGKERLNANRLLRARKILGYVVEHLDPKSIPRAMENAKPEDALELYCHGHYVHPRTTLMNIRTYIWRSGGDVHLTYKPKWAVGGSIE